MAYDRSIKVPQSTIDEIKKLGMTEAIKKANSGSASKEFLEGAKRFYGGNRVKGGATTEVLSPPQNIKNTSTTGNILSGSKPASTTPSVRHDSKGRVLTSSGKPVSKATTASRERNAAKGGPPSQEAMQRRLNQLNAAAKGSRPLTSGQKKEREKLQKQMGTLPAVK